MIGIIEKLPIKNKLILIIMLTSLISLLIISSALIIYDRNKTKELWTQKVLVLGEVIADRSTAAISFNDQNLANENLSALRALPAIALGCIYDISQNLFAAYRPDASELAECPKKVYEGFMQYENGYMSSRTPILLNNAEVGSVYIVFSLDEVNSRLFEYVRVVLIVFVIVMLVAYLLSELLQRFISQPVIQLTELANNVALNKDYSVKNIATRKDEIGVLIDAFIEMLKQIENRANERDKAEAKLRQHQENLEGIISARTRKLQLVIRELEAFSYSVSHDLRTPLRSIDGFSQIILEDYSHVLDDEAVDLLKRVRASSQHMGHLIDDLLKLSRMTRSELSINPVNLSELMRGIYEQCKSRSPERKVEVVIQENIVVDADRNLLSIAMENLFSNAWKYTNKNELARIEFGQTVDQHEVVYFLKDNGVGFNMDYAKKLFQPFQRLHDASEFEGTGIGLATVARVIHRHDGEIWAESEIGKGTTFFFTLNAQK